jgi:hypothetical protein
MLCTFNTLRSGTVSQSGSIGEFHFLHILINTCYYLSFLLDPS